MEDKDKSCGCGDDCGCGGKKKRKQKMSRNQYKARLKRVLERVEDAFAVADEMAAAKTKGSKAAVAALEKSVASSVLAPILADTMEFLGLDNGQRQFVASMVYTIETGGIAVAEG